MLIHRDNKEGPVIASVDLNRATEGISVIEFKELQAFVELKHVHHKLPFTHANTYFTFGGKKYHWKAHAALLEDDTRICLAAHHTVNIGGPRHRLGSIVLTSEGLKMRDLVAVTRLAEQARSDEAKLEVCIRNKYILIPLEAWGVLGICNLKLLLKSGCSCNDSFSKCQISFLYFMPVYVNDSLS